ncbi:hypothetical protein DAI22_02g227800 [Oryza sativa Japonica Group]|nr:hypothetical protein DAI22_02g227800 [Oryza sativa Japonica Group]
MVVAAKASGWAGRLEIVEVATGERLSRWLRAPPLRPPSPHSTRRPSPPALPCLCSAPSKLQINRERLSALEILEGMELHHHGSSNV